MAKKISMKPLMKDKIFVQIAAYRDPQLIPTIKDCIANAKYPENLVFSIAWQHSTEDEWDKLYDYQNDPRFKIIDIDYRDACGPCFARHALQQNYNGEEYTLQLDSHSRFIPDWDVTLINLVKSLQKKGHAKPLLTGYAPSFDPANDPAGRITSPWRMNFDRFAPEGVIHFLPATIDNFKELTEPIPARFYSAHFAFSVGEFAKEVQHDPEYYFHGEEISIAVRAYTSGYDLFHPHIPIVWHEYTRVGSKKQWDDDSTWGAKNEFCYKKNKELFGIDGQARTRDFGIYDLGKVRTLDQYERYAGVKFSTRGVQQFTLDNNDAPNPVILDEQEYADSFKHHFKHCIDIYAESFTEDDYDFWVVSFEKADGTVIHRKDADEKEIASLLQTAKLDGNWVRLWRSYFGDTPDKWVVWLHSKSKGWLNRVEEVFDKTKK